MSPVCFEKQVPSTLTGQTWTWPHLAVKPAFLQHRTLIDKWTTWRLSVRVEFYDRLGLTRKVVALAIRLSKRERERERERERDAGFPWKRSSSISTSPLRTPPEASWIRSEEHTSELQSLRHPMR